MWAASRYSPRVCAPYLKVGTKQDRHVHKLPN